MPIDARALLLIGLTVLLWGLWGLLGKIALQQGMPPVSLFLAEAAAGALCALLVALAVMAGRPYGSVMWNAWGLGSGAAMAVGLATYYFALERAPASVVVPLTAVYPLVSVLLFHALLRERLEVAQWSGVVLISVGTALLLYPKN